MRKLRCYQVAGRSMHQILDEFNQRAKELGVAESDIISVNVIPATGSVKVESLSGLVEPNIEVIIVFWSDR